MGSDLNFNCFGNDLPAEADGGGTFSFPPTRQLSSVYSLTFDEFQTTLGGIGKDFGSMNMDEFLKNIWNAEENQSVVSITAGSGGGGAGGGLEAGTALQRQGSLILPRKLSMKTVDQVWQDISKEYGAGAGTSNVLGDFTISQPSRQPTLGEITLEEFLMRAAGAAKEETGFAAALQPPQQQQILPNQAYAPTSLNLAMNDAVAKNMDLGRLGLGGNRVETGSPVVSSNNGNVSSVWPSGHGGGVRGRKVAAVEKVVERRHRRMIKNRESAARSRARKQAYTTELEEEVAKLKEENEELQRKHAEMIETQREQAAEAMKRQKTDDDRPNGSYTRCLRRTHTGPW